MTIRCYAECDSEYNCGSAIAREHVRPGGGRVPDMPYDEIVTDSPHVVTTSDGWRLLLYRDPDDPIAILTKHYCPTCTVTAAPPEREGED